MNKCLPMLLKTQGFKMKTVDKVWFLSHSDWIYNNRHKLQSRPCAEFVITGFVINSFGCPYYGYMIDKITIGNFIKLWNNGFVYKDFPLIHYEYPTVIDPPTSPTLSKEKYPAIDFIIQIQTDISQRRK